MHLPPLLASVLAMVIFVLAIEITKEIRRSRLIARFGIPLAAFIATILVAANLSQNPESTGEYLFYLMLLYFLYKLVFGRKKKTAVDSSIADNRDIP